MPKYPFDLFFKPTGKIAFDPNPPGTSGRKFTDDLKTIPSGSVLYNVYALDKPVEMGGTQTHIADLTSSSEMVTSLWGDKNLLFRH